MRASFRSRLKRPRSMVTARSVVGQMFILLIGLVLLLVAASVLVLYLHVRHGAKDGAATRSLVTAQSFAGAPGTAEALRSPDPTAVLQPRAEGVRERTHTDFVVVLNREGIRFTHPDPDRIGERFIGTFEPAREGKVVRETTEGTLGPSVRSVVPVRDEDGEVIGMVAAGVTLERINLVAINELPLLLGAGAGAVALATGTAALVSRRLLRQTRGMGPAEITRMYERHDAVLHAVREGMVIVDAKGRLLLLNEEAARLLGLPDDATGRDIGDLGLDKATVALLSSGDEVTDEVHMAGGRLLTVNHRLTAPAGRPGGTVTTLRDTTELRAASGRAEAAQKRLELLYAAGIAIGTTLDVIRTAEELTEVAVPEFADYVTVDLVEPVFRGGDSNGAENRMRRAATGGGTPGRPVRGPRTTLRLNADIPQVRALAAGRAVVENDLHGTDWWQAGDEEYAAGLMRHGFHAVICAPLHARGVVLGVAGFWRAGRQERFDGEDLSLAEELAARTAVCVDNARRYAREHELAATLQRSLLPRRLPEQNAVEAAYRYQPAEAVGGDFFDVIPLSGARVALVVGDVVGHGLHAAAAMGRLRTAVHNFAALDLPPDELLGRLDELADRDGRETASGDASGRGTGDRDGGDGGNSGDGLDTDGSGAVTGATCLYAIYDPVERLCTLATAGHLPPALVHPDGTVEFPRLIAHPPLGVAGMPFEPTELRLAEGTRVVLYTDGLIEARDRDIDVGLGLLRDALTGAPDDPDAACDRVLDALLPERPTDDVAVLIARTQALALGQVASWDVPFTPSAVAEGRAAAGRQLAAWGLAEIAFITELILSEMITNALVHGSAPIRVRLLRDRTLICEVSDGSSTSPHLRNATATDEGGRGLFLVAQYADRWGTRYTAEGKVIWAEQRLPHRPRR
ncbi:SpoIIE family protein phosphatase/ATP-binding protein [Streptomyces sp. PT12]|uniref:SpoIIE family protein phosphatase/ATP-binding protein n=1 Tax=Streptomyces sp. PT12 TaxID=1510197 RepID=UPI000DE1D7FE|nr:SpoIIE family protein phosphatase/ATP-binding protein [Streptomyces sp. PT12]RBM17834.1 histidine kinase [Streptomyces sp. PT12]